MKLELILSITDHVGVLFFAISGMLTAGERNLDIFGGYIIAFITALGGGTIRDVLLNIDIAWMGSVSHVSMVILGGTIGLVFRKRMNKLRRTFFIFDTVGIALFTILGVQKGLSYDQMPFTAITLGMISATFGGLTRDVLCNKVPLIFRKEIYAIPCLTGGAFYLIGLQIFPENTKLLLPICMAVIITFRTLAVVYEWKMPLIKSL
jgi:uncharacterized membrane protein YeiH